MKVSAIERRGGAERRKKDRRRKQIQEYSFN